MTRVQIEARIFFNFWQLVDIDLEVSLYCLWTMPILDAMLAVIDR